MSRTDLVAKTGLSYPYLSNLETDKRSPSLEVALTLTAVLGTTLDNLFGKDTTPEPAPVARSQAVADAVSALKSLPRSVRLEALNQVQFDIVHSL